MWSFFSLLIENTETLRDSTISLAVCCGYNMFHCYCHRLLRRTIKIVIFSSWITLTQQRRQEKKSKIAANCRFQHENVTWMRNHALNGPPIDDDDTLMALFVFKLWCEYGVSHSFNCNSLYMATDWPVPDRLNSTKMAIDWLPLFFQFWFASHSIWPIISHAFSLRVDPTRPPNEKWIYLQRCV